MKIRKCTAIMAAVLSCAMLLNGCGSTSQTADDLTEVTTSDQYPLDTDVTLRYWMVLNANVSATNTSFNTTKLKEYLEEATGVKLKFEHPAAGQEDAAFNILLASDDMPDIIEWNWWSSAMGGPEKMIDDGVILKLNSYIDKASPNLKKTLDEHPEWEKLMKTSDGSYFAYPFIRSDDKLDTYFTYIVRKDLLEKAGLDAPKTLKDWEEVLYAFKDMGIESPLSIRLSSYYFDTYSPLTGLFGFASGFYHDKDGNVKYGPYEEAFRDYVTLLNKFYNDGILDKEFADDDKSRRAAMVTNGKNGIIDASIGGEFGNFISAIEPGSGIEYAAISPPVMNEGDSVFWTQKDWSVSASAAISATSKNAEIAARFLDFGYSDEGHMLYNFGKENVSFEYKDGERGTNIPTYTPNVVDPAQNGGLSVAQGMANYCRATTNGPFVQDLEYIYQYYAYPEQKAALELNESDTFDYKMPYLSYTNEEQKRYTDIMTAVGTYQNETMIKMVAGKLGLDYLDTYYEQLESLGIKEAIEIVQAAYDRTLSK